MTGSRKRIDVLLVNPGSRMAVYQELGDRYSAIEPPSLAGLFATYLRQRGLSVEIVDAPAHNLSPAGVAKTIRDNFEPALIVMVVYGFQPSASTQNMTAAGETCSAIKALRGDFRIMMTGTHPAALPERTLLEEKIDFVCDREGPETILLTAQALKARSTDFSKIPSLWYRDGKAIRSNAPGELMDDLDGNMPGVAWDLLPMKQYRAHNWHSFEHIHERQPYVSMHTSLGCPYKCTFCLREGTVIVTAKGKNKKIEELVVGDRLLAWDEQKKDIAETTISQTASRTVDRLLRITMASGETIEVTDEHPIYTERGWVDAGNILPSDRVFVMETRDKMRYQMRTNNPTKSGISAEWRKNIGKSVRGKRRSAESKERYRLSKLGDKNPMKRPEVALAPVLREGRSKRMKELWADPQRAEAFNATRPTGEKHSRWAGGLSQYPWPLKFNDSLKRRIRKRDDETCQECGVNAGLTVHHIDYDKDNCDDCNLITLCRRCNSRANANRHQWRAKYSAKLSARGHCPSFQEVRSIEELNGEFRVYNFECSPHDNYWAHRVLVHNCCINAPFGKSSYRMWSPETVIQEIDLLVEKHGVKNIKFVDEMFVLNRNHVLGICDRIIERGHKLNIWAYARVDTVKEEFLDKLARAGFRWLALGIESASKHVRDGVEKGRFGSTEILKVVKKIQDAGINVIGNYIFGLPDDTHESMQETLDLALEANCEFANFYCLPPGTPVYTPHGTRPIEEIAAGDEVLSWSGRSVVKGPMSRPYKGTMYRIKPRFLPAVRLTDEHPVLVATINRSRSNAPVIGKPRWVKPKDIVPFNGHWKPYDAVIVPKSCLEGRETKVDFSQYVNGHVGPGRKGGQLNDVGKRYLEPWPVTEELAELFGWYVAEGSRFSRKNKQIGFSLGANESENVARVRHLVSKCFELKTRVRAEKNVRRISLTSKVLLRALPSMFGEKSCEKRAPAFIMESRDNIARAFLRGYVAGDGTSHPNANGQLHVSTCSPTLARQLIPLFMKTGIVPGCLDVEPQENRKGIIPRNGKQYHLTWTEGKATHCFEDEHHFYIPVSEVASEHYDGMVYNIETGDETYAVPFIVHNCAMAYPGSKLYGLAVEKRWQLPESWIGYSQHSYETLPLRTDMLTSAEVLKFRDDAFHRYFTDAAYLGMAQRKFGEDVVAHLRDMTKIRLRRKLLEANTAPAPLAAA